MSSEVAAIEKVLQVYFDGLYEGDTKKLGEAFHPASHLYSAGGDGKRPDATNLSAKFEAFDAEIGEAASSTPSRRDGKSMVDDLAKHAAECAALLTEQTHTEAAEE